MLNMTVHEGGYGVDIDGGAREAIGYALNIAMSTAMMVMQARIVGICCAIPPPILRPR